MGAAGQKWLFPPKAYMGVRTSTNISSARQTQHACSKKTNHTTSCALTGPKDVLTKSLDQLFNLFIFSLTLEVERKP